MDTSEKTVKYFAVIVGDWHYNSLGIIRSLGEKGITVYYLNMSEGGYGEDSIYTKQTFHVQSQDDVLKTVQNICKKESGRGVIFPASDTASLYVDNLYAELSLICECPHANKPVDFYMNKFNMCEYAKRAGFCVPESTLLDVETQLEELSKVTLPVIIKPVASVEGQKSDIKICLNNEDLNQAKDFFGNPENNYHQILVQQFLNGKENLMVEYCGCKSVGKKVQVLGQIEKIREYPVDRGSTTYAVIKEKITYIDAETLDKFLDAVGYDGIFDLEIKVVDGKPYFIEINFRNGAPSYGYTAAGFNIPFTWFADKAGWDYTPSIRQVHLMSERDDLDNLKDKNISPFKWLSSIKNTDAFMVYNAADSTPFKNSYGNAVTKMFKFFARKSK